MAGERQWLPPADRCCANEHRKTRVSVMASSAMSYRDNCPYHGMQKVPSNSPEKSPPGKKRRGRPLLRAISLSRYGHAIGRWRMQVARQARQCDGRGAFLESESK